MINSIISFKKIPIVSHEKIKMPTEYKIKTQDNQDCFVRCDYDYEPTKIVTKIDGEEKYDLAQSVATVVRSQKILKNNHMDVWGNQKNKGLGAVLHLNNIIELFENKLEKIEQYSLGQAVLFHAKCKFKPEIRSADVMQEIIYDLTLKDRKEFPELKSILDEADIFLCELEDAFYNQGYGNYDELMQTGNGIIEEYLDVISSKKLTPEQRESYGFTSGFDMSLTKEEILENKDFFNGLYKKYNIDYKIR